MMKTYFKIDCYFIFRYMWLIVILPKVIQSIFFVILFAILLTKKIRIKFDIITVLIFLYSASHLISIFINIYIQNFEISRVIAALNTACIWIVAALYYNYYLNKDIEMEKLEKICFFNIKVLIFLSVISIIMYNFFNIKRVSILGVPLYGTEWFNSTPKLRFGGLVEYANLIVFFYLLFFPLAFNYVRKNISKSKTILFITLSLLPIVITLSRSGYIVVFLLIGSYIMYILNKFGNRKFFIFLSGIGIALLILSVIYFDLSSKISEIIISLIESREGSNNTRMYLYRESIRVANEKLPLFGQGIKITSLTGYPLGSHSTFIGFYYKAGILGLAFGIPIFININYKLIMKKLNYNGHFFMRISLLLLSLMLFVEDLDGASWFIVIYFSIIGIILKFSKKLELNR